MDRRKPATMEDNMNYYIINEELTIWEKNASYLYELMISHILEWPSLTVQWLPDVTRHEGNTVHRLLLGTHTPKGENDYLIVATFLVPKDNLNSSRVVSKSTSLFVDFELRINHEGEVNRARYMPQRPSFVATKSPSGDVLVFDIESYPPKYVPDGQCAPKFRLKGHEREGYGLAWSRHQPGTLLSGSEDRLICVWDINSSQVSDQCMQPFAKLSGHCGAVQDVVWNHLDPHVFASVSDDQHLLVWDLRTTEKPVLTAHAHHGLVNCVDFSPHARSVAITGGSDHEVGLWDLRYFYERVRTFKFHTDDVLQVQFCPDRESVFASGGFDRRIAVWDMSRIEDAQTPQEAKEGPPELMFVHGGHTKPISDFSWNKHLPMTFASVAENNVLQIWQMGKHVYM